jgi:hypothetical protein
MSDTYDDYYLSGKAEADWAEFIDAMFQYANQENNQGEEQ